MLGMGKNGCDLTNDWVVIFDGTIKRFPHSSNMSKFAYRKRSGVLS